MRDVIDLFVHLDRHLRGIVDDYGGWTYAILFFIVFAETGLVVTPFLPGDSLLFAAGALAAYWDGPAAAPLDVRALFVVFTAAAVLGNAANYQIGRLVGERAFDGKLPLVRREHLERTRAFYARHGARTLVIARFVPVLRTFAPFVAGVAGMPWAAFTLFNVIGGVAWVSIFLFLGYFFGNQPWIREHFEWVILGVFVASLLPAVVEYARHRWGAAPT